jgi:hypothetical protein
MTAKARSVTLHGSLVGELWMPGVAASMPVREDLAAIALRFVNADGSGLADAVRSVVDGAGDFRCARLTADSFVAIEHRQCGGPDGRRTICRTRRVDIADLPSLADYVAPDVYTFAGED